MTPPTRRATARHALAAALLSLLAACGSRGDASARPRAVVLVTVAGLRGDVVGFTGRPGRTPFLDALARRGRVFPRAYVATPEPAASVAALQAGAWPRGGVVLPERATLAERFRAAGFVTAGASLGAEEAASAGSGRGLD